MDRVTVVNSPNTLAFNLDSRVSLMQRDRAGLVCPRAPFLPTELNPAVVEQPIDARGVSEGHNLSKREHVHSAEASQLVSA